MGAPGAWPPSTSPFTDNAARPDGTSAGGEQPTVTPRWIDDTRTCTRAVTGKINIAVATDDSKLRVVVIESGPGSISTCNREVTVP